MRKSKLPPGAPDDTEQAFYEALQHADIERFMACWADEDDIVCVQPGGPRLVGHIAVREAFEALFAKGGIHAVPERVRRLEAPGCSVHSVIERVDVMGHDGPGTAWVLATNVYAKTAQGWRLVAHHASPGTGDAPEDPQGAAALLH